MKPRTVALAVAIAAGLLGLAFWIAPAATTPAREGGPSAGSPTPLPAGPAASASAPHGTAARKPRGYAPGSRTTVPRRVVRSADAAPSAPEPTPPAAPAEAAGPVDRREDPGADGAAVVAAIRGRVDAATDDIAACLTEWHAEDPDLAGEVMMGFRIDADGLQEAWVQDHSDVPLGPLSCFGSAIYAQDWTGISEDPLEITFPFTFDNGEDAADAG